MSNSVALQPIIAPERINSVDTIRGISLFGILLMNIVGMGLYKAFFDPTNSGGSTGWDLRVWWTNSIFFEGTMRGLFSMLFSAGIVLFMTKKTDAGSSVSVTNALVCRLVRLVHVG